MLDRRGAAAATSADAWTVQPPAPSADAVLDRVSDAVVAFDREWRFVYLNRRAEEHFGRPRAELLGKNVWAEIPSAVGSTLYRQAQRALETQEPCEFATRSIVADRWMGVRIYPGQDGVSIYFRDVTAERRAEQALRESEAQNRAVIENSLDGIFFTAPDGRIFSANPAACRLLGYTEDEIVRIGRAGLVDPTDASWGPALRERERAGKVQAVLRFLRKDGSRIVAEVSSAIFVNDEGERRACIVLRDVTDARRAERRLGYEEVRFRRLVELAPEGIWTTNELGQTEYVNSRMGEMLGYPVRSLRYAALADFCVDEGDRAALSALVERGHEGWTDRRECRLRRADGAETWALLVTTPLLSDARELLGTLTVAVDITAPKRVEEALRFVGAASREILDTLDYEATLRRITDVVVPRLADMCIIDAVEDGDVHRIAVGHRDPSKAARLSRAAQYRPSADRAAGAEHVVATGTSELVPVVTDEWLRAMARDEEHLALVREVAPTSVMIVPLRADGRILGAITLAVTDGTRRFGPADLAMAEALADWAALGIEQARVHAQALEATRRRDEVLRVVSHDLRGPLTSIRLVARLLERRVADADRDLLARVDRSVAVADRLIADLLDVARVDAGKLELDRGAVDVERFVEDAVDLARARADDKGLAIEIALAPDLPPLDADAARLAQVLNNLLDNALKLTPSGGRIQVAAERDRDAVRVSVEDTGPGIAPDHLAHVFDRFWQAKAQRRAGAGLGLAIAKGIVEAHGGRIWVESEPGRGAAFRFTCPCRVS